MANFCLMPEVANKFKKDIIEGKIDPIKLSMMTSAERRAFFNAELGESNAEPVNALFESKLLLKNQQAGMVNWAKRVMGTNKVAQRDIISRIQRMDKVLNAKEQDAFLEDLAAQKLGTRVSFEEAQKITELSKKIEETKLKIPENSPIRSKERMEYGTAVALLKEYVGELKLSSEKLSFKDYLKNPSEIIYSLAGNLKSIVASLDNSFFGRQGIKTLYTHPTVWVNNFAKSWVDIGKELKGKDAMLPIRADVYSRPNALNGKYEAGGYGLDVASEEAFPSSWPEKIPVFGRLFKASESAYNGAALRMRADLADMVIKQAEQQGVNTFDKTQARGIGNMISSMTGRGNIGAAEPLGKKINTVAFSIKFLKSNLDTLTMHRLGYAIPEGPARTFVRKQAAFNLLKIIGTIAGILTISELLHPDSVEKDPRSSNFGKLKIGDKYIDISGGMTSLVSIASKLAPTQHDGEWGFWTKNAQGKYTKLNAKNKKGEPLFGARTALDVFDDFWQGKLSPLAGVLRDVWQGQMYGNKQPTLKNELLQVTTPISAQTFQKLMENGETADTIMFMILEGLGFNVGIPFKK